LLLRNRLFAISPVLLTEWTVTAGYIGDERFLCLSAPCIDSLVQQTTTSRLVAVVIAHNVLDVGKQLTAKYIQIDMCP